MDLINNSGIDSAKIRSVLVCESRIGVCAKCYGRDLARGTDVNIGEVVGVIAAQSIGEPGTQQPRTFHVGGAATWGEANNIEALVNGVVKLKDANLIKGPDGKSLVISRSAEMVIVNDQGQERARHRLLYGAKIFFEDGDNVNPGDVLVEWDPYTTPIITETEGIANFMDLVDGVSMREVVDESTGITSRVVIETKQSGRSANLRPRITLRDEKGNILILSNRDQKMEARYFLPVGAILSIDAGSNVKAGEILARIQEILLKPEISLEVYQG